ncbi:MAG: HDOD domain-containing protein [bacterium]|nr:HDOD domain-containing protein [bacterium]
MDKQKRLMQLFSGNKQLPALPVIFSQLNQMLDNPFTSNKKISTLMMKDQSMVAKILKLSNSAMYSKRQEISNLANAITFLGTALLRNLVLQISMVRLFDLEDDEIPDFSINTFWEHSLGTAYFTQLVTEKLNLPQNDDYYLGGLLHDIGKLCLYQFYPDDFKTVIKKQISDDLIDYEAEEAVLGVTHQEIGTFLAEKWKFKSEIVNAIRDHHKSLSSISLLAAVVRISNLFTKAAGLCFPWDKRVFEIPGDPAWAILSNYTKGPVDVERMTFEITDEIGKVKDSVKELLNKKN